MIGKNIAQSRREAGMSQEDVAVRLGVVRQTVSKWEKELSVPDADLLVKLAQVLDVPVSRLLGTQEAPPPPDLAEELARVNALLAEQARDAELRRRADGKRGLILFLSFAAMLAILIIRQETVAMLLSGGCMLAAVIVLWRNLALLTRITAGEANLRPLRITTTFTAAVLLGCMLLAALLSAGTLVLTETAEKWLATGIVAGVMAFMGAIAPRLPFTRHTGLRLPWTVRDEDTWKLAHRILGDIALPVTALYIACVAVLPDMGAVTLAALAAYIGIPGVLSFVFYWKKMTGRL